MIGNAKYKYGTVLNNPVNDANDMAQKLKELGFEVILVTDGDLKKMDQAVNQFYKQLRKGSVALFYYAGHGIQVEGENYLIPIDVNLETASDAKYKTLATNHVLDKMHEADSELRLVILDACRDNPFARNWKTRSNSLTRGLARIENSGAGDFIAYATQPGNVSSDGTGRNGVFTSYLLKHLNNSTQTIEDIFKLVRHDVARHTKNEQVPFTTSGLTSDFYFAKVPSTNVATNTINNQTVIKNNNVPEIRENNQQNAEFYLTRANSYYKEGKYDQAFTNYNQAIQLNPQYTDAYLFRGLTYRIKGELDKAIVDYTQAIKINPQFSQAYNNRGVAYDDKGELDKAIVDYNQAIKINPQYSDAYNNRGVAYDDKGELDKAIADYTQAIKINPQFSTAYNNRGLAYRKKGELEKAIVDYNQAIKINPQYFEAYNNRGIAYYDKGELDQAIVDYNQAIKINPQYSNAYVALGLAYEKKGKLDQAIADYNQAIKFNPQHSLAYYNRGIAYYNKGELDKAIADYNQAIKFNPQYFEAYNNRGVAYEKKEEYDQALKDYDQAVQLDPNNYLAIINKERVQKKLRNR